MTNAMHRNQLPCHARNSRSSWLIMITQVKGCYGQNLIKQINRMCEHSAKLCDVKQVVHAVENGVHRFGVVKKLS